MKKEYYYVLRYYDGETAIDDRFPTIEKAIATAHLLLLTKIDTDEDRELAEKGETSYDSKFVNDLHLVQVSKLHYQLANENGVYSGLDVWAVE